MKLVKEILYEKFTDESDPIHDLGIGLYVHRNFKSKKKFFEWLLIIMPYILKTDGIPKDILKHGGVMNSNHFEKLENFFKQYVTFKGVNIADSKCELYWWTVDLRNILLEKGYEK
jgi:hypothetical protein